MLAREQCVAGGCVRLALVQSSVRTGEAPQHTEQADAEFPTGQRQPGLGLRQDGQRAEPPPLDRPSRDVPRYLVATRPDDLRVRGNATLLSNPFALQYGAVLRAKTNGGDGDPISKQNYTAICQAFKYLAHREACTKWLAFGLCRDPNCRRLHDNWPVDMNGEVLNSKYRDLAQLAGVPQSWQPARPARQ